MRRKQHSYEAKTACVQTGSSPLGEVRERSIMITYLILYNFVLSNLSPVSPKGEKQFVLLTKNGDITKYCTEANWPLPFRGGKGEVENDLHTTQGILFFTTLYFRPLSRLS